MKKAPRRKTNDDVLPEYDFSAGQRGRYAQRFAAGSNVVVLAPEVAAVFPDSTAVNEALRTLIKLAGRKPKQSAS